MPLHGLEVQLAKYQNPNQADAMSKIQCDLDETKIILLNTIDAVLERGEKLDELVAKSDDLSAQSKMFYKTVSTNAECEVSSTTRSHSVVGKSLPVHLASGQFKIMTYRELRFRSDLT